MEKLLPKKGNYLEIGAYHPTRLSNTYRFYKRGWNGVVVEPNPEIKELFNQIRPRDKFINCGVSTDNGEMNYYMFLIPAINTFSKVEADQRQKEGHKLVEVKKIKMVDIKKLAGDVDLLSLDTEGFDEQILKGWPWKKYQPKVICTEKEMALKNYRIYYKNKYNFIYLRQKQALEGGHKQ